MKNGTGLGATLSAAPIVTIGLLKLFYIHGSEKQLEDFYSLGNTAPNLGFCYLGFSIPDLLRTLECHGRRRYAFPIRLSRGDDVKVGPRSSDDEVCLSYIYSYD